MKHFVAFSVVLVAGCGSESTVQADYAPPPTEDNSLLSDSVTPQQLHFDLQALGALEPNGLPDECLVYWELAARTEPATTLDDRPNVAARSERCADFADTLASQLKAEGYGQVEGADLHDIAVWQKALSGG